VAGNTVFFDFEAIKNGLLNLDELHALNRFRDFAGLCFQVQGARPSRFKRFFILSKVKKDFNGFKRPLYFSLFLNKQGRNCSNSILGVGCWVFPKKMGAGWIE